MTAIVLLILLAGPAAAAAQSVATPTPVAAPASSVSIPLGTRVGEIPATGYDDGGRRDPFGSLVLPKRTAVPAGEGRPRRGLAAVALNDVTVKGIVRSGSTMLAILESPGKQSFVTRVKDQLLDATVLTIERDGVIFSDRSAGVATEIRKPLRPQGEEVR